MRRFFVVCVGCVALSSAAFAITVEPEQGKSFLNRGNGYRLLKAPATGKTGNTVMASADSSAIITYDDGCKVKVNPGEVVVIKKKSPCEAAFVPHDFAVGALVVGGVAGGIIALTDKPASP